MKIEAIGVIGDGTMGRESASCRPEQATNVILSETSNALIASYGCILLVGAPLKNESGWVSLARAFAFVPS